jgi:magnesium transporter
MQDTQTPRLRTQRHNDITWIDIERPSPDQMKQLEDGYKLHPIHVKESLQTVQHTEVTREDDYLFFVLHVPLAQGHRSRITVNQVGIFLGKDYLITVRTGSCPPVTELFDECERQTGAPDGHFKHSASYLLYALVSSVLANVSAMIDGVLDELDDIEDVVFDGSISDAEQIGRLRQKIVRLSRLIGPKRFVLQDLAGQIDAFSGHKGMAKYYASNTVTANKLWEIVEEAKETVEVYKDADFTANTEKTNRILMVLTLLFTLSIPMTVLGALYGMNVFLPGGLEAGSWTFLGRYTTLWVVLAVSVLLAGAMYAYFRRKKWF